ncbi:glycosyltransferase [Psychroflexus montanilacus]|uniref:glycosyltransferase n=1 Tax=Psychroflexus montanilacus TaxID=2873598 RepID=UPI001CCFB988|nr:glycosyltransferase [Psychroflexus montanilacus]MBZ9652087.1 glycosyltransferase [Psychroflexus montanilacus]
MTLCIISHTEHYQDENGIIKAWGSTVTEINHLLGIFDRIIHVAPLHEGQPPKSSLVYADTDNITFIPLKPSGGKGLKKLNIALTALSNLRQIQKGIQKADIIHFRAPTGMGLYVLPYLKWFSTKPYWVKYAGNWVDPDMPLGNRLQKQWLQNYIEPETQVTYNGNWETKPQFLSFDNPCFTEDTYTQAKSALYQKSNPKDQGWILCFVGALNEHKGVPLILEALKKLPEHIQVKTIHFIGDGPERAKYEELAQQLKMTIYFHGFLPKPEVHSILAQSDALILPSKSEGFPKVVGEAMAYGCMPIVSKVSCIEDYITHGDNGFVLQELSSRALVESLVELSDFTIDELHELRLKNYTFARRFTYEFYNKALKEKILNVRLR